ncbi:MAG TPA: LysR family transcriptional regulator [Burkholderiales bacterium]|jgi:predicted thioesterase|nr:LysR family transcriptional regulator [Burkholderiales bacterium]
MKPTLKPGLTHARNITVDESRVIEFMGRDCRVYATPRIISDVEYTCRDFLLEHLDPGEDSVGTKVNWEHVGPALFGDVVAIAIKLAGIDGRRVTFEATVNAGPDAVARGTHERFIVDVHRVRERLLKKMAQRS